MKRVLWMAALLIWTTLTAHACLWDSDTLKDEAKGLPDVIQIITGRFERNPPLYYSIRLDRVAAALKFSPKSLELYDDAGVACDRLGHDEEAIQWMAKKRAILDGMPADDPNAREHRYRYFANIGTFRIHRWIRAGADRRNLQEAKQARAEINEALALNPNAHFGREAYQAQVIGWIIDEPRSTRHQAHSNDSGEKSEAATFAEILIARKGDSDEAVKGLAGLIALGSAWESTDVFSALSSLLNAKGKSVVAYLAQLRCEDAETWSAKRTDYMLVRLKAGRHPDTDANFWSGYHETEPPSHDPSLDERAIILSHSPEKWPGALAMAAVALLSLALLRTMYRRFKRNPLPRF